MENRILANIGLVAFCAMAGEPVGTQTCKAGTDEEFEALVFNDPLKDEDTYVSISSKLPQNITLQYLIDNANNLQVVEIEPDAATVARRKERASRGEKTQMKSYVLCPKGAGTRTLFKGSLLAALGIRTA